MAALGVFVCAFFTSYLRAYIVSMDLLSGADILHIHPSTSRTTTEEFFLQWEIQIQSWSHR